MKYLSMPCNSRRNQFDVLLKNGIENLEISCQTPGWKPQLGIEKNPGSEIMLLGHGAKKGNVEN